MRRIAFAVWVSERDQFSPFLPELCERVRDVLRVLGSSSANPALAQPTSCVLSLLMVVLFDCNSDFSKRFIRVSPTCTTIASVAASYALVGSAASASQSAAATPSPRGTCGLAAYAMLLFRTLAARSNAVSQPIDTLWGLIFSEIVGIQ